MATYLLLLSKPAPLISVPPRKSCYLEFSWLMGMGFEIFGRACVELGAWVDSLPEDTEDLTTYLARFGPPDPMPPYPVDKEALEKLLAKIKKPQMP